jgi:hypothetical protein
MATPRNYEAQVYAGVLGKVFGVYMGRPIEGATVLWWGSMGVSTEHTAYLRLKRGLAAPASGSVPSAGAVHT